MPEEITRAEAEAIIKVEIAKAVQNIKAGRTADAGLVAEDVSDLIPKADSAETIFGRFNASAKRSAANIRGAIVPA